MALGLADVLLTSRLISFGAAELNPVMAGLLAGGPGTALLLKILVMAPVAAAVWWLRRYRRILEFSLIVVVVFAALIAYQAVALVVLNG